MPEPRRHLEIRPIQMPSGLVSFSIHCEELPHPNGVHSFDIVSLSEDAAHQGAIFAMRHLYEMPLEDLYYTTDHEIFCANPELDMAAHSFSMRSRE